MSDGTPQSDGEEPWKDKDLMFRLYHDEDYTYAELADRFGCGESTVSSWMMKHRADKIRERLDVEIPDEHPHRDEDLMKKLYVDEQLSTIKISAVLGCSTGAVNEWLGRHGIETRSAGEAIAISKPDPKDVYFYTHRSKGYEMVKAEDHPVAVHRLQAVAYYGFDALEGKVVHHRREVPWLNTEDNLELMTKAQHHDHHKAKMTWLDRLRAAEMYREGASSYDISPTFDVSPGTVLENIRRVDSSLVRNNGGAA